MVLSATGLIVNIYPKSLAYWELYRFTNCWRHLRNRWPRPNHAFVAA